MSRRVCFVLALIVSWATWMIVGPGCAQQRSAHRSSSSPGPAPAPAAASGLASAPVLTPTAPGLAAREPAPAPARVELVSFRSSAFRAWRHYLIWLPPNYARAVHRGERFPVLYLLHGLPGNPRNLLVAGEAGIHLRALIAAGRARPMLLVVPDGRLHYDDRSDGEWADTPSGRFASLVTDVVADVDRRFASIPDRLDRGIAGYSAGGYGAVNLALHRLDLFSVLESWSGYFTQAPVGVFAASSPAVLAANSPTAELAGVADRLRRLPLSAWIYTGEADLGALAGENFAKSLDAAGAHVRAEFYTGDHNWWLWRARMDGALLFASDAFGRRARARSDLRLAPPSALQAARDRYLTYLQEMRYRYCARHGAGSRSYCRAPGARRAVGHRRR